MNFPEMNKARIGAAARPRPCVDPPAAPPAEQLLDEGEKNATANVAADLELAGSCWSLTVHESLTPPPIAVQATVRRINRPPGR